MKFAICIVDCCGILVGGWCCGGPPCSMEFICSYRITTLLARYAMLSPNVEIVVPSELFFG